MMGLMAAPQPMDTAAPQQMAPTSKTYLVDAPWLLAIVLVVFTILAYEPVWHAGFVWDDDVLIVENRMITAVDGLHRFWFTTEAPDYFPLTSSLWWMEWRLWGSRFDEVVRNWEAVLRLDSSTQNAQRGLERVRNMKPSGAPTTCCHMTSPTRATRSASLCSNEVASRKRIRILTRRSG